MFLRNDSPSWETKGLRFSICKDSVMKTVRIDRGALVNEKLLCGWEVFDVLLMSLR